MDNSEWIDFYSEHLDCSELVNVINACMTLDPSAPEFNARRMMLQCKRLVDISNAQQQATINNHALKLFFIIVLAENSAKFYYEFDGDGQSKKHVRKFFEEMMPEHHRGFLQKNITNPGQPPCLRFAVDFLYSVRCDVAHEGMYYKFHFRDSSYPLMVDAGDKMASISLTYEDLVKMTVETAYVSIREKLGI